jgi:hypothetical protein
MSETRRRLRGTSGRALAGSGVRREVVSAFGAAIERRGYPMPPWRDSP